MLNLPSVNCNELIS